MNRLEYTKEAIRQRVGIRQVVERYTYRRFDRNGFCSCPLHREKTASFKIDEAKQLYYCFGCGEGGDIYKFVSKYFGIEDFRESVSKIDEDFGTGFNVRKLSEDEKVIIRAKTNSKDEAFNLAYKHNKTSVKDQIKLREEKKQRALELQEKDEKKAIYDDLCTQYRLINELLKYMQPMTDIWGRLLTKKAWLEYEMDKSMEGICK